jgi:hypothetical protein
MFSIALAVFSSKKSIDSFACTWPKIALKPIIVWIVVLNKCLTEPSWIS